LKGPGITKNVLISVSSDGSVQHWHTTSGRLLHTIHEEDNQLFGADYKPDGTMFAVCGNEPTIKVYDEMTRKLVVNLAGSATGLPGHELRVFAVKFDKNDENLLCSGGWDKTVQVWDLRMGGPVRSFLGPSICGDSLDIFDGFILTGSYRQENPLEVWDLGTAKLITAIDWN
jgi:COMPASS component SWD3